MPAHPPSIPAPVQHALDQIISFPNVIFSDSEKTQHRKKQVLSRLELQEKEESLNRLQSILSAKSNAIQKKEEALSERWDAGRIYNLSVSTIDVSPYQPRREFEELSLFSLANSIREHGILQPLTVRRASASSRPDEQQASTACGSEDTHYQLICGERRLRAAVSIGMKTVPCIILDADNRRAAELALIENLQRENLNLFEQAAAISALIDMHAMTQEEIARALSVSQSYIANKLRVLRLTADEREVILSSHLTERHARAFLRIKDLELRRKTVRETARNHWNVAQTEQYVDTLLTEHPIPYGIRKNPSAGNVSTETENKQKPSPSRKCILSDLRLFFNTVDRALATLREAGFFAECKREESGGTVTLTVSIRDDTPSQANPDISQMTAKSFT